MVNLKRTRTQFAETRRSVSAGVIMRCGHCLKVWTKQQQVASLSTAESQLYAALKTASEGLGIPSVAKDLGIVCRLNLHLDATPGQPEGRARQSAATCRTCGYKKLQVKKKKVRHEEGGYALEPRRLDDETPGLGQLKKPPALNSWDSTWSEKGYIARNPAWSQQRAE